MPVGQGWQCNSSAVQGSAAATRNRDGVWHPPYRDYPSEAAEFSPFTAFRAKMGTGASRQVLFRASPRLTGPLDKMPHAGELDDVRQPVLH